MVCVGLKVLGNWVGKLTQLRNIHVCGNKIALLVHVHSVHNSMHR